MIIREAAWKVEGGGRQTGLIRGEIPSAYPQRPEPMSWLLTLGKGRALDGLPCLHGSHRRRRAKKEERSPSKALEVSFRNCVSGLC